MQHAYVSKFSDQVTNKYNIWLQWFTIQENFIFYATQMCKY